MIKKNLVNIAIIGVGLCGSAAVAELVNLWKKNIDTSLEDNQTYRTDNKQASKIFITAILPQELSYRLGRINQVLSSSHRVKKSKENTLQINYLNNFLEIEGSVLNIIPDNLNKSNLQSEEFIRDSDLYRFLEKTQPQTLIIGANLAAIIAYKPGINDSDTLAWVLSAFKYSIDTILSRDKYSRAIKNFLVFGTTALGGMDDKIPFSHGPEPKFNPYLTKKILAAGGILNTMDRYQAGDHETRFIHLMPGALLGIDEYGWGDLFYYSLPKNMPDAVSTEIRNSSLKVPLFLPLEFDIDNLSDKEISWYTYRIRGKFKVNEFVFDESLKDTIEKNFSQEIKYEKSLPYVYLQGAYAKFGESGKITLDQARVITDPDLMGFVSAERVSKIAIDELKGRVTGYNVIPLGSGSVIEPDANSQRQITHHLEELEKIERKKGNLSAPNSPALGGSRFQAEIAAANLIYRYLSEKKSLSLQTLANLSPQELSSGLWDYLVNHPVYFAEITSITPVISPQSTVYSGPYLMIYERGISKPSDLSFLKNKNEFEYFTINTSIDLRVCAHEGICCINRFIKRADHILKTKVKNLSAGYLESIGTGFGKNNLTWARLTEGNNTQFDRSYFVSQYLCSEGGYRRFI